MAGATVTREHLGYVPIGTMLIAATRDRDCAPDGHARPSALAGVKSLPCVQVMARLSPRGVVRESRSIRINTGIDLPFLLEQQPGVGATSDGGTGIGYTYMRIRGTDGTRTNITLNGVPFNDAESQGAFLVNLPDLASSMEDIEVQRGVGSSTNGPAAFGASVNIRTTAVKREPWALLSVSGGSFSTKRYSVSAGTGLIDGQFSLDARLSSITTDGYVDRAGADLKSYFLQGAWVGAKRSLRFHHLPGRRSRTGLGAVFRAM